MRTDNNRRTRDRLHLMSSTSDLYKSDLKLQGNTNTQLKLLSRASYTGK